MGLGDTVLLTSNQLQQCQEIFVAIGTVNSLTIIIAGPQVESTGLNVDDNVLKSCFGHWVWFVTHLL